MVYIFSKDFMVLTRHLQISSSHVLMKFLNSSKVSVDLILTEFQIFGPREARICVKFIIIWSGHNKGILGLCSFWPWSVSFFERNFSYTVAWIQAIFCSTYFCINVSLVGLFASVSSFCLCFGRIIEIWVQKQSFQSVFFLLQKLDLI